MEAVLDVYQEHYDAKQPLICMDEASRQLLADVTPPLPPQPGTLKRVDDKYERRGVRSLLMFYNPIDGWRRVGCRESRTRSDWAEEVRRLLEEDYPEAECVTLVSDNLNTHDIASLYYRFDCETAGRLRRRLRLIHTPKNGSWLNMAEQELSVLSRQCLGERRFDSRRRWMRRSSPGRQTATRIIAAPPGVSPPPTPASSSPACIPSMTLFDGQTTTADWRQYDRRATPRRFAAIISGGQFSGRGNIESPPRFAFDCYLRSLPYMMYQ